MYVYYSLFSLVLILVLQCPFSFREIKHDSKITTTVIQNNSTTFSTHPTFGKLGIEKVVAGENGLILFKDSLNILK